MGEGKLEVAEKQLTFCISFDCCEVMEEPEGGHLLLLTTGCLEPIYFPCPGATG